MKKFLILLCVLVLSAPVWSAHDVTTLQELEQDVKNNLAVTADPYFPDSTLDDFINLGCREVASYGLIIKHDSVIVTSGDAIYALNEDFMEALAVFPCTASASRGLDRINFRDWGKIAASTQLTEARYYAIQPEHVTDTTGGVIGGIIHSANIWLYPAHSGVADTLVVKYSAEANELLADTSITNVPYAYRNLVSFYATALAFARSQEYDRAAWWFALFDQTLNKKLIHRKYGVDYLIAPKQITK